MKSFLMWLSVPFLQSKVAVLKELYESSKAENEVLRKKLKRTADEFSDWKASSKSDSEIIEKQHADIVELTKERDKLQDVCDISNLRMSALTTEGRELLKHKDDLFAKYAATIEERTAFLNQATQLQNELLKEQDKTDILSDRVSLLEKVVALNHKLVESAIQLTVPAHANSSQTFIVAGPGASDGQFAGS